MSGTVAAISSLPPCGGGMGRGVKFAHDGVDCAQCFTTLTMRFMSPAKKYRMLVSTVGSARSG